MRRITALGLAAGLVSAAGACQDRPTEPRPLSTAGDPTFLSAAGDPFSAGLREIATGFASPVSLTEADGRLFVVDQAGLIRVIEGGELQEEPFLDISDRLVPLGAFGPGSFDERGLLGLAFHPAYPSDPRFYVYYSAPGGPGNHVSHLAEYRASADPGRADPASERLLLQVPEPQFNHNAGALAFGPDGHLYVALGDGGGGGDMTAGHVEDWYEANAGGNGQDIRQNLLGNILRLDVDASSGGRPYGIPADNPFFDPAAPGCHDGCDEIYAYGLRNPYRMSWDPALGLLVSDAGQGMREEVNQVTRGGNYGWNVKEGTLCFNAASFREPFASCPSVDESTGLPLLDPVIEYENDATRTVVVGGHVYRGEQLPQLRGRYLFADWSTGFGVGNGILFAATPRALGQWPMQEIRINRIDRGGTIEKTAGGRVGEFVQGFGQDSAGEVYVLTNETGSPFGATGKVYQLIPPSGRTPRGR